MILAGTGHRPDKLPNRITGYDLSNPTYRYIRKELIKIIKELEPEKIISGMALGFDQLLAQVSIDLHIPLIAAVPFVGQESIWPLHSKDIYKQLIEKAAEVMIVSQGGYSPSKMQIRNKWMVDQANAIVACFDGSRGGTANCVEYANSVKKQIIYINPQNM